MIKTIKPAIFLIQETNFKPMEHFSFPNYNIIRCDRQHAVRSSDGCSILIRENIPYSEIPLNSNLEACSISCHLGNSRVSVCSLYLPPSNHVELTELVSLVSQIPSPLVLMGDLNAHHSEWGSTRCDSRGAVVLRLANSCNMVIKNDCSPTYISPSLDLSHA